jgi:hypothetical protein
MEERAIDDFGLHYSYGVATMHETAYDVQVRTERC